MKPELYHTCTYNRLPEDEPSGSKHVEEILKNENISLTKVPFVGLYYAIIFYFLYLTRNGQDVYIVICYFGRWFVPYRKKSLSPL